MGQAKAIINLSEGLIHLKLGLCVIII